jgi:hypothetical protein
MTSNKKELAISLLFRTTISQMMPLISFRRRRRDIHQRGVPPAGTTMFRLAGSLLLRSTNDNLTAGSVDSPGLVPRVSNFNTFYRYKTVGFGKALREASMAVFGQSQIRMKKHFEHITELVNISGHGASVESVLDISTFHRSGLILRSLA